MSAILLCFFSALVALPLFAAGMGAVEQRDLQQARESSLQFDAGLWRMSQEFQSSRRVHPPTTKEAAPKSPPTLEVRPDALLWPLLNNLGVHSLELRASIEAARGNTTQAKRLFAKAIAAEKALGYHEPPIYIRPAGEAEGAAMLAAGDWAGAKAGYEEALKERPQSGFALYGIALANEKSGDAKAATKGYADFLAAWKNADPTLPQVQHARAYLAAVN